MMSHSHKAARPADAGADGKEYGFSSLTPRQKASYVLRHFNSIALTYDFMNTVLSFGIHHVWKRIAVNALSPAPGSSVLDVCGGTGDLAILAAKAVGASGSVVICDVNRAMMHGARHKILTYNLAGMISLVQGDAECMPFPDDSFDAAMVGFGIRNLTDMERGLSEMHRVIKPGGSMMCLEFSVPVTPWFRRLYDFYSFTVMPLAGRLLAGKSEPYCYLPATIRAFPDPEAFSATMTAAGFSRVRFQRFTNGIAVIYKGTKP